MIIKNIAKLCRESRYLAIHQAADGVQWIGNGHAFYAVPSLPQMTFDQACAAFDYNDKVKKNIIEGKSESDRYFILSDSFPFETYIEEAPEDISMNGRSFKLFRCAGRVFFINSDLLSPVADIRDEKLYFMRYVENTPVLCVKRGLIVMAVIYPYMPSQKEIEEFCGKLSGIVEKLTTEYRSSRSSDDDDQIKL